MQLICRFIVCDYYFHSISTVSPTFFVSPRPIGSFSLFKRSFMEPYTWKNTFWPFFSPFNGLFLLCGFLKFDYSGLTRGYKLFRPPYSTGQLEYRYSTYVFFLALNKVQNGLQLKDPCVLDFFDFVPICG
jgi:hypothetical protein